MGKYILKRILYMFLTLLIVTTLTFFLMRNIPGDPLASMAQALPDQIRENFHAKYGLDKPLFEQYLLYLKGLAHLDMGDSVVYAGRSVSETIKNTSPVSGFIGGIALFIGVVIGTLLGIIAALNKNKWPDFLVIFIAILGVSVPVFVLAALLQMIFAARLGLLPSSGWGGAKYCILPITVLCLGPIASYARYVKSSMLDTLDQDYVMTARAKGMSESRVIRKHVLRNSMLPAVTIFGGSIVGVFTGSFVIEKMFSIPGIGFYYINSINSNDYTMILGTTIFYAALFVIMQLIVDCVYVIIDPRIRITGEKI